MTRSPLRAGCGPLLFIVVGAGILVVASAVFVIRGETALGVITLTLALLCGWIVLIN